MMNPENAATIVNTGRSAAGRPPTQPGALDASWVSTMTRTQAAPRGQDSPGSDTFVVRDSRQDPLVRNSPATEANDIGAYAGAPLETTSGNVLGTVCVVHHRSRDWTEDELAVLGELSALAVTEVEYGLRVQEAETIRVLGDRLVGPLASLSDAVRETATLARPARGPKPELLRMPWAPIHRKREVAASAASRRLVIRSKASSGALPTRPVRSSSSSRSISSELGRCPPPGEGARPSIRTPRSVS